MDKIVHKKLSYDIVNAAMYVHNNLGPGFLEKVYENALCVAFRKKCINCQQQVSLQVVFENEIVGDYFADIVVDNKIILELKACKDIANEHRAQMMNSLILC